MHKARENVNGTFSIGKTWMLDDLTSVRSFNGSNPTTAEEEQQKQWAGGIGFIVTIGKPYYWQANTQKEKQFFIASLVKIFTKYTGGKTPELIGFDQKEMDQLLGISTRSLPPSQTSSPAGPGPSLPYGQAQRPPRRDPSREPMQRQQPVREAMARPPAQMSPGGSSTYTSQTSRPQLRTRREDSPSGSIDSNGVGSQQNQATLRRLGGSNQSQESFARSEDSVSLPPRSRGGMNGMPNAPGRFQDRSVTPTSQRATTPDSAFSREKDASNDVPPVPAPLALPPERRRPPIPIIGDSRQRSQNSNDNMVPAPLVSPGMRREDLKPPARSSERTQPRDLEATSPNGQSGLNKFNSPEPLQKIPDESTSNNKIQNSSLDTGNPSTQGLQAQDIKEDKKSMTPTIPIPTEPEVEEETRPGLGPMIRKKSTTPSEPMSPETEEEADSRPGLGPMIRKKKSRVDIANTFLKAAKTANSFNSFKPRAGGAAERLREAAAKAAEKSQEGPDGITGVVPAPSLLRGISGDNNSNASTPTSTTVEKLSSPPVTNGGVPEVKITVPQSDRPSSLEGPMNGSESDLAEKAKAKEVKRPKPASETMQKELASLDIDPSILGGRGNDLIAAWDQFGWVGEGVHTKNIDQMGDEIERELNKIQAGGWLTRMDEEDERVAAVHAGLDKCIEECDELDGLLTLYLVELSVSLLP